MKSKQFISGLIVGSIVATSVGVFAGDIISAIQATDTKIYVDGEELLLESGYEILNYNSHIYTSTRSIAEALGAEVSFKVVGDEKQVIITSPVDPIELQPITPEVPVIEEPIVIEEPVVEEPEETEDDTDYRLPPVKSNNLGVSVLVKEANTPSNETRIDIEVTNNNSEGLSMFNYSGFKLIDENNNEYRFLRESTSDRTMFYSSIDNGTEDATETLRFNPVPVGTKVKLIMPLTRTYVDGTSKSIDVEIPFIIEEYDSSSSSN